MLKFKYLSPNSIKITTGKEFYDNFILTRDDMYDYDFNSYDFKNKKKYTESESRIKNVFSENKKEIESFFFRSCGM
jgi:hypothetical protein